MKGWFSGFAWITGFLAVVSTTAPLAAQEITITERPWTGSVLTPAGAPIIPLFDGWYSNADGTHTLCFGYYSPNWEEDFTIPLGANNFIEPAQFDGRQPDYFEHIPERPFSYRRRYCAFSVQVPADFGTNDRVTWTLQRGREQALSVPGKLVPAYQLDEPTAPGRGDIAPGIQFGGEGPVAQGRNGMYVGPITVEANQPVDLTVAVDHPDDEVWVGWAKHQGPGMITFSEQNTMMDPGSRTATATARFSEPGEYMVRIQSINNPTQAFEFHCCWTNVFVEVIVN